MPTNEEFKQMILEFIENHGMSDYAFGIKANNDSRLVYDLKRGREFGEEIKIRVMDFMQNYIPEEKAATSNN